MNALGNKGKGGPEGGCHVCGGPHYASQCPLHGKGVKEESQDPRNQEKDYRRHRHKVVHRVRLGIKARLREVRGPISEVAGNAEASTSTPNAHRTHTKGGQRGKMRLESSGGKQFLASLAAVGGPLESLADICR